jgi:hypothetical protein
MKASKLVFQNAEQAAGFNTIAKKEADYCRGADKNFIVQRVHIFATLNHNHLFTSIACQQQKI